MSTCNFFGDGSISFLYFIEIIGHLLSKNINKCTSALHIKWLNLIVTASKAYFLRLLLQELLFLYPRQTLV